VATFSPAGLIGALIGLVIGVVQFKFIAGVVEGSLRRTDRSQTPAERADYERRIRWFRRLFFVEAIAVLPIIGYLVGRAIAG
jgi:hypothetical protein